MSSQAYNRYSYCLNNPLKNIDPSGNIVEISSNGVTIILGSASASDIQKYTQNDADLAKLYDAWELLSSVATDLTDFLEDGPEVLTIQFADVKDIETKRVEGTDNANMNIPNRVCERVNCFESRTNGCYTSK